MTSFKMTKSIDVGKAQGSLASWARKLQGRPLIVTEGGKPLMVLVPVEEGADVESLSLSMNPQFVGLIEKSRARHKPGSGVSSDEMRQQLGIKRKGGRKVGRDMKPKAKSKVEVAPRGVRRLRNVTKRDALREAYRRASKATRASLSHELRELDHLTGEGLPAE